MKPPTNDEAPKSWIERLGQALLREPKDVEQLLHIIREANERQLVDTDTLSMLEGVIHFSAMTARDIMIPRSQMVILNEKSSLDEIFKLIEEHGHSRYPVIVEGKDEILGILHAKDLLKYKITQDEFVLSELLRLAPVIPESKKLNILLNELRSNRNHLAIVVDEYGAVSGFVTIEDIIEQIVGDIEDEFDIDEDAFIKKHKNGKYIIKAHIPIDEFNEYFAYNYDHEHCDTIGGMLMKACDHVPNFGEVITIDNAHFKILNSDNRRIKLVEFYDEGVK